MSRNDQFFGCFLPHLPKGARITDTTTFHWGKWDQNVLHGLDSSAKRSGSRRPPVFVGARHPLHVPTRRRPQVTRVRECYKCAKWRPSVCYYHIPDHPSKSGAQQLYQEVCCSFAFFNISRVLFLFSFREWDTRPLSDWKLFLFMFPSCVVNNFIVWQTVLLPTQKCESWCLARVRFILLSRFGHAMLI